MVYSITITSCCFFASMSFSYSLLHIPSSARGLFAGTHPFGILLVCPFDLLWCLKREGFLLCCVYKASSQTGAGREGLKDISYVQFLY